VNNTVLAGSSRKRAFSDQDLAMERYRQGLGAATVVSRAENALTQAELGQLITVVQLYRALGGGWQSPGDAADTRFCSEHQSESRGPKFAPNLRLGFRWLEVGAA
jgi:hypothetical protein